MVQFSSKKPISRKLHFKKNSKKFKNDSIDIEIARAYRHDL